DALIEGFRPGKMEKLGLGPDQVMPLNPRLIYGRMTGWGQSGPLAALAGHDLNYLALSGLLSLIGPQDAPPPPPLNLVSDFGGGGMYLAFGLLTALWQARATGKGAIVDAAMVHGTTHLATFIHGLYAGGRWSGPREGNLLDGGAPFYRTYETRDGRYVAVAALEAEFFQELVETLQLDPSFAGDQYNRGRWPEIAESLRRVFAARDLSEWTEIFAHSDACVSPVLTLDEALAHPQMRDCFCQRAGIVEPAPAPRITSWPPDHIGERPS
ncbi:MAG TPA: CaiB/BaiF CoA-transferase family protein, partial [Paracoccus sp. (in: a-proteobacteria)]|uniref:CaiB/BaiF CoA transferase family protein n=1 Tax=Paracoccus sp. TaxID=267 RepID=UPI002C8CE289